MNTRNKILLALVIVGLGVVGFLYAKVNQDDLSGVINPTPTPTPTVTISPTITPSQTPTPTPTATRTSTPSPTRTVTPSPSSSPVQVPREISLGSTARKQVIFSFDAGSGNEGYAAIMAALDKHNITSTFFVTGKWVDANPALAREIAQGGHEIFNHTYTHTDLKTQTDAQIRSEFARTEEAVKRVTGKSTKPYFRPPYGARDTRVLRVAAEEGYQSVYWSTDALDWRTDYTAQQVKDRVMNGLKPGAIYLMHVGSTLTAQVIDELFTEIKAKGYSIVTLQAGLK